MGPSETPYYYFMFRADSFDGDLFDSMPLGGRLFSDDYYIIKSSLYQLPMPHIVQNCTFLRNWAWSSLQQMVIASTIMWNSYEYPSENVQNNAILNEWVRQDPRYWLWVMTDLNGPRNTMIANNYWGTSSTTLIDSAIMDYQDDALRKKVIYQPILTTPPETTYPFVAQVDISQGGHATSILGPGEATFTATFNRDMDASVQPQVSFGPDTPVTDYTVHPVNGGWQNPRTWTGTFNINPITGDGYQLIRIAGARAASDPWLVTGDDAGRFRFEIITSGTEAMNLQATGGESKVDLMWTQDDFDLLAGFNIYRSDSAQGGFTRLNTTIIPAEHKNYTDRNVQPGKPYFYKFTVVKTDMTESDFSNVASATPLDTIPPVIVHTPVSGATNGLPFQIYADVTDNVKVVSVTLYYRAIGQTPYSSRDMVKTIGDRYAATLEGSIIVAPGLEYYLQATDGVSIVRSGRADLPYRVNVTDKPEVISVSPNTGTTAGGAPVTISGSNFKTGASVAFGGALAGSVFRVSDSQLTAVTPAHFAGVVDVTVTNTGGGSGTLLRGYTYQSNTVQVSIPDTYANQHALIDIPVIVDNVQGLRAAYVRVTFNNTVLSLRGARAGSVTAGFSTSSNTSVTGEARVSLANATAVSGTGAIAYLQFEVVGTPASSCDLTLAEVALNDGAIPVLLDNGTFTVSSLLSVSGYVLYYMAARPVGGAALNLNGSQNYTANTDQSGAYGLSNIPTGNYSLAPQKSDEADAITSYDASLILQCTTDSLTLSSQQQVAADVDGSGAISPIDASYVLEKAVELIGLPFPGIGKVWAFQPSTRSYSPLASDVSGQDFTAVLIGDVSGNWHEGRAKAKAGSSASVSIPEVPASPGKQVTVPIVVDSLNGNVYSADIVLTYDASVMTAVSVTRSGAWRSFSAAVNLTRPGQIRIAMAGASPVASSGELLKLTFEVTGGNGRESAIQFDTVSLNEGAVPAGTANGRVRVAVGQILTGTTRAVNISKAPQAYENWQVTLEGEYGGWEPGHGAQPVTKSDWLVYDGTTWIYITGSTPNLQYPQDKGAPIIVGGTVRIKDGVPYIDATPPRLRR